MGGFIPNNPGNPNDSGSGLPIIGPIIQLITDMLGGAAQVADLGRATERALDNTWANALSEGEWAFDRLKSIWDVLKAIGLGIGLALYHLWEDFLKPILQAIICAIKKLHAKLAKILKPIVDWIKKIRDWYLKHIFPWQHLALQIISGIRVFIELLRLLNVKWAAKLDAELQKIQGYITESITAILGPLNSAISILSLAVDPGMVFRRDFFGRTLWNSLGDVKKAAGYGSARPLFPDEKAQEKQMQGAVYGAQPLQTAGPGGSVVYDPALQVVDDSLTQQMQTTGVTQ